MMLKSKVKYIQSLSQKKHRDEEGAFIAEGPKIINELLGQPGITFLEIYALPSWIEKHALLLSTVDPSKIFPVEEHQLKKISSLTTPNQVLAVIRKPFLNGRPDLKGKVTLMADAIQDPGNMGTLIRCADWFGAAQLICSPECADAFSAKTVQSSMGSIGRVSVCYEDLVEVIAAHPSVPVYAATLSGRNLYKMDPISEGVVIVGNESKGIGPELLSLATEQITIPRRGHAESLNAAVAMGVILSHLLK